VAYGSNPSPPNTGRLWNNYLFVLTPTIATKNVITGYLMQEILVAGVKSPATIVVFIGARQR